jgi:hypothetical protein
LISGHVRHYRELFKAGDGAISSRQLWSPPCSLALRLVPTLRSQSFLPLLDDRDGGAFMSQSPGDGGADAPRPAGNQSNLVLQTRYRAPLPSVSNGDNLEAHSVGRSIARFPIYPH